MTETERLPDRAAMRALDDLREFIRLAVEGIGMGTEMPRLADYWRDHKMFGMEDEEAYGTELQRATRAKAFADKERQGGYPLVSRLACVHTWSALEVFAEDTVVHALQEHGELLELEALQKLKGPLLAFAQAEKDEQTRLLVHMLSDSLASSLKPGLGGFELLLKTIQLGGYVHDTVRRGLLELSQVRNVFVHRGGIADERLSERCPWRPESLGERLAIDVEDAYLFIDCAFVYVLSVHLRQLDKWWNATAEQKADYRAEISSLQDDILKRVPEGRFGAIDS